MRAFQRKRPVRKPFPDDIERERVVVEAPTHCACCGRRRLSKLGEDVTETLEEIPRRFKVIETVREKFTCRDCEAITQPPAPFHATPRGFIGPQLLATILFDKFGQHMPLNRQSQRFKCEGIELSSRRWPTRSAPACSPRMPLYRSDRGPCACRRKAAWRRYDDPDPGQGQDDTGRIWTYVRDDQPFGGPAPPAALYYASRDRRGEHPQRHLEGFTGILQADAYSGFNPLFDPAKKQTPITPAFCCRHARRKFFELADIARNARRGRTAARSRRLRWRRSGASMRCLTSSATSTACAADERLAVRQERSAPLLDEMEAWLREQRAKLSRSSTVIKPIDYMLKRWDDFSRFVDDGRICLTNNAAERALRGLALGRKRWLFAGSDRGAERAAVMLTLIMTARLNEVDPKAWLADVFARIAAIPQNRLHELLPWKWKRLNGMPAAAAAA